MLTSEMQAAMERMLGQEMLKPINPLRFLEEYVNLLGNNNENPLIFMPNKTIVDDYNLDFNLKQPDDPPIEPLIPGNIEPRRNAPKLQNPASSKLKIVQAFVQHKTKSGSNPFRKTADHFNLLKPPSEGSTKIEEFKDVILTVRFYRSTRVKHNWQRVEKPHFAEEFECLGSNLLTDLRDKIHCVCNDKYFFDISENPNADLPKKETDPGFFFITNTFYNDKRNPKNDDYSKTVIDWAKNAIGLNKCTFFVRNMETTHFFDLNICLGFPNLYLHHGNCEHVFTFSNIYCFDRSAMCQYVEQYPRLRAHNLYNNRKCDACGDLPFVYVVQDSYRQLTDPTYLCKTCLKNLHYIDGKKVGEFKAYRIYDTLGGAGCELDEGDEAHNEEENKEATCSSIESITDQQSVDSTLKTDLI